MWKVSPKTPHTQFLCRVQFYKLALKTNRGARTRSDPGRPSQVDLWSKYQHSPKKHQPISIKKRKAQNHKIIKIFIQILHSMLDASEQKFRISLLNENYEIKILQNFMQFLAWRAVLFPCHKLQIFARCTK
jgi:hypothetical protein